MTSSFCLPIQQRSWLHLLACKKRSAGYFSKPATPYHSINFLETHPSRDGWIDRVGKCENFWSRVRFLLTIFSQSSLSHWACLVKFTWLAWFTGYCVSWRVYLVSIRRVAAVSLKKTFLETLSGNLLLASEISIRSQLDNLTSYLVMFSCFQNILQQNN